MGGLYLDVFGEILESDAQRTVGIIRNTAGEFPPDSNLPSSTEQSLDYRERSVVVSANQLLGRVGSTFWQDESFDHWVRNDHQFERITRYIEDNPVTAGLVKCAAEWPWSSATRQATPPAPPT